MFLDGPFLYCYKLVKLVNFVKRNSSILMCSQRNMVSFNSFIIISIISVLP